MRKIGYCLVVASLTAYALPAQAGGCCRPVPNWYAGLSGSVVFLDDVDRDENLPTVGTDPAAPDVSKFMYAIGYGMSGNFGYRISPYFRAETEFAYRSNDVDSVVATPAGSTLKSNTTSFALMANGYFDYYNSTKLTPYVGAGIGYSYVDLHYHVTYDNGSATESHDMTGWAPAYQFMFGVAYETTAGNTPVEVYLGYKYFKTGTVDVDFMLDGLRSSFSNHTQSLELGGRLYLF